MCVFSLFADVGPFSMSCLLPWYIIHVSIPKWQKKPWLFITQPFKIFHLMFKILLCFDHLLPKKWCQLHFKFSASCRHYRVELSVEVNKLVCLLNSTAFACRSIMVLCLLFLTLFVAYPKMSHGASCPTLGWLRHCSDTQLLMIIYFIEFQQ